MALGHRAVNIIKSGLQSFGFIKPNQSPTNLSLSLENICETIGQSNIPVLVNVQVGDQIASFEVVFNKGRYIITAQNDLAKSLAPSNIEPGQYLQESATVGPLSIQRDGKQLQIRLISEVSEKTPVNKATLRHSGANFVTKVGSEWYGVVRINDQVLLNTPQGKIELYDGVTIKSGNLLVSRKGEEVTLELIAKDQPVTKKEVVVKKSNVPTRPKPPVPEIRPIVTSAPKRHPAYSHYPAIAHLIERAMRGDTSFLARQPLNRKNSMHIWASLINMDRSNRRATEAKFRSYIVGEVDFGALDGPDVVMQDAEHNAWLNYHYIDAPIGDRATPKEAYANRRRIIPILEERNIEYHYNMQNRGLYYGPYLARLRAGDDAVAPVSTTENVDTSLYVAPAEKADDEADRNREQGNKKEQEKEAPLELPNVPLMEAYAEKFDNGGTIEPFKSYLEFQSFVDVCMGETRAEFLAKRRDRLLEISPSRYVYETDAREKLEALLHGQYGGVERVIKENPFILQDEMERELFDKVKQIKIELKAMRYFRKMAADDSSIYNHARPEWVEMLTLEEGAVGRELRRARGIMFGKVPDVKIAKRAQVQPRQNFYINGRRYQIFFSAGKITLRCFGDKRRTLPLQKFTLPNPERDQTMAVNIRGENIRIALADRDGKLVIVAKNLAA